ncbi:MAG: aspartyl protease family protein [Thermoplasmata archaeon]
MGQVELTFDPDNLQFFVAVMIPRPSGPYVTEKTSPGQGPFVNTEFLVDTGSNSSSLNEETARKLGIKVERLPTKPVAGINGMTLEPVYPGNLTLYLNDNLDRVVIEDFRVFYPHARRVKQKVSGIVVRKEIVEVPMPNLFGLDAVRAINGAPGKLRFDLAEGTGRVEW